MSKGKQTRPEFESDKCRYCGGFYCKTTPCIAIVEIEALQKGFSVASDSRTEAITELRKVEAANKRLISNEKYYKSAIDSVNTVINAAKECVKKA